ncbi:MAG: ABC transporter ATP-binding protein [Myxococcales bacterium]|nr:ABC transporter ATP-binding protein [Myxococcales bacterium]
MVTSAPALRFRHVQVRYPGHETPVLRELSLEVAAGERVALLGLNGSGKTTLLLAAVGLIPFEGTIEIAGIELSPRTVARVRERVGLLFAVPADQLLFPRVIDDVAFSLVRRRVPKPEARFRARGALENFAVADLADHSPFELSHGQKTRVALAGTMVTDPAVLLLDEPSAGLDPPGRLGLIRTLVSRNVSMLAATHDLEFARRACQRAVLLEDGRLVDERADLEALAKKWSAADGLPGGAGEG